MAIHAITTGLYPLPRQRGEYGELLIMTADSRWDLTRRLKGQKFRLSVGQWLSVQSDTLATRSHDILNLCYRKFPSALKNNV